ncbi:MAG: hypothetical protein HYZ73_05420 [Elusimicrobia bacterium]|nr:hypothetical protein [Elusimicrobiota bacterium]
MTTRVTQEVTAEVSAQVTAQVAAGFQQYRNTAAGLAVLKAQGRTT